MASTVSAARFTALKFEMCSTTGVPSSSPKAARTALLGVSGGRGAKWARSVKFGRCCTWVVGHSPSARASAASQALGAVTAWAQ